MSKFREIDLAAETIKLWGPKWHAPEVVYEFSSGSKKEERTGAAGIYAGTQSSGDEILLEEGNDFWLLEDDGEWVQE